MRYFTKSKYKVALECPAKLYYYDKSQIYANLNKENEFLKALAEGGYQIGELAKMYYPGGYDIKTLDIDKSLEETCELLKKENVIIYEAAVKYKNCFIRVDILNKRGNRIDLIEVKAKSYDIEEDNNFLDKKDSYIITKWKPYLYDIAFQKWVIKNAFPEYSIHPYLMLTDKSKRATVDGLNQLFRIAKDSNNRIQINVPEDIGDIDLGEKILIAVDVQDIVEKILIGEDTNNDKKNIEELKSFEDRIEEYSEYYCNDKKYPASISKECKKCEFKKSEKLDKKNLKSGYEECWRKYCGENFDFSEPHIFDVWNFKKSQELIDSHIYYMKDIPKYYFTDKNEQIKEGNPARQYLQIEKTLYDPEELILPELYTEMKKWKFPLHFIDFETMMSAIPFNKGKRPYEQTAFQFSSHTLYEDGTVKHDEFLFDKTGEFPNFEFVKSLKSILDKDDGTIFRYAPHENTVLRQIQRQMINDNPEKYDEYIVWIDTITQKGREKEKICGERNMVDMLKLVKEYYYHPRMKGSNSIKVVLPALLSAGKFIKNKYSEPLQFGTHLKNKVLYQYKNGEKEPANPYDLLEPIHSDADINEENIELLFDGEGIKEGGVAATAYARMQFSEMSDIERKRVRKSLLQYCELDTLAMLMIYEHWINNKIYLEIKE